MPIDPFEIFLRPHDDAAPPAPLKALSIRMPQRAFRYVQHMAEAADLSRNAMAVQLIEWGIAHALSRLPDEMRDEIQSSVDEEITEE
jgi:predicted transcriptional regulator